MRTADKSRRGRGKNFPLYVDRNKKDQPSIYDADSTRTTYLHCSIQAYERVSNFLDIFFRCHYFFGDVDGSIFAHIFKVRKWGTELIKWVKHVHSIILVRRSIKCYTDSKPKNHSKSKSNCSIDNEGRHTSICVMKCVSKTAMISPQFNHKSYV